MINSSADKSQSINFFLPQREPMSAEAKQKYRTSQDLYLENILVVGFIIVGIGIALFCYGLSKGHSHQAKTLILTGGCMTSSSVLVGGLSAGLAHWLIRKAAERRDIIAQSKPKVRYSVQDQRLING